MIKVKGALLSMRLTALSIQAIFAAACGVLACATVAHGQPLPVTQIAGPGAPSQTIFPTNPSSLVQLGAFIMGGDAGGGWRQFVPVPPGTGIADGAIAIATAGNTQFGPIANVGGPNPSATLNCAPFCNVGQVTQPDAFGNVFLTAYDKSGGLLHLTVPGVYRVLFPNGLIQLAPTKGTGGDAPQAVAFNPVDGKVYYGGHNPNIRRITNPLDCCVGSTQVVETVGGLSGGQQSLGFALAGHDLYISGTTALNRVLNVAACVGNKNGCGNATVIADKLQGQAHSGLAADPAGNLYYPVANTLMRYNTITGAITAITAASFVFCATTSNLVTFDPAGNLYFGDGACGQAAGRIWRINAAELATLR